MIQYLGGRKSVAVLMFTRHQVLDPLPSVKYVIPPVGLFENRTPNPMIDVD